MSTDKNQRPRPVDDQQNEGSKDEPATDKDHQVSDPHPDTEEGYDQARKVPMTGL